MKKTLIEILFILIIFSIVQLVVFIRYKKTRLLLFNYIPSMILLTALLLSDSVISKAHSGLITAAGLFLYPFTISFVLIDYFPIDKKRHLIKTFLFSTPFLAIYLLSDDYFSLLLVHTSLYLFLIVSIKDNKYSILLIFIAAVIPSIFIIIYYLSTRNIENLIILLSLLCISFSLFTIFQYSRRLYFTSERFTSINSLNKRLNQAITRLKQRNDILKKIISQKDVELLQIARHASLAEVTTGIAHELAQPLTGIKCISQNMIDDINYQEFDHMQAVSDLVKIASLVDRSSSIIDHIRTFSRKRGFSFQQADLNACILNAIELINNQIKDTGIDLIFVLDDSVPRIYGDNLSLEQLFINLILNAKDAIALKREAYKEHSGIIKITTTYNDETVKLIIEDNGIGIPEDIIPKIWTPFFTTKKKGKGTGIGLSLSHRIIREHNADVSINSSGKGTVFTIIFPVEHTIDKQLQ